MKFGTFSFNRKLSSYAKVQSAISMIYRSRRIFMNKSRIKDLKLLNVGCGPNPKKEFINLDYNWSPQMDICWDITRKPYPIPSSSLEAIYTEHCLEHIS